jgi:hypothetical protein
MRAKARRYDINPDHHQKGAATARLNHRFSILSERNPSISTWRGALA